ncbi:MAG: hypothetical protein ACREI7_01155 [Myxococcota bacterium]
MLLALALWACAGSPLDPIDGGWRNARHGYWIGNPQTSDSPWEPEDVEGSLLAFRRSGSGAIRMTFSSRCGVPLPPPQFLARHLRIGIPANVVRESGPVQVGALTGWQQVFDAEAEHGAVRVKTVTVVANGCALDWVLTGREASGFEEAERDFDAWWGTLRVEPQGGTAEAAAPRAPAPEETP